ncbi:MAG TPA: hypothetical protein VM864_16710 [Pyrinomonadaceae bacterium]|jgi:hypothetical protein|nr:hypothetical protein [Pyrinomonadaceae bacterium]
MRFSARAFLFAPLCAVVALLSAACAPADNANSNTTATTNVAPPTTATPVQTLSEAERPQKIKDQMTARGEQDEAKPTLRFVEPRDGATVAGSTVKIRLALSGDLKGYQPHKDPATGMGNHIHVILDNQPYEAYYNLGEPFELRNVTEGKHTLRVFASRPWHESYKNDGSFQMVAFTVRGGGDATKPTTTATGQTMADNKNAAANRNADAARNANAANANAANANAAQRNTNVAPANPGAAPAPEGKDMPPSQGGEVDRAKPLLTYSRPKGEYKGADADAIMIDFWLSNAKLQGDGGDYRVRYTVDDGEAKFIDKWSPIWLAGWNAGAHKVKLELVDKSGNVVDNGGYNSTERTITVTK